MTFPSNPDSEAVQIDQLVLLTPGGLTGGGGVGSVSREINAWLTRNRPDIAVHVLDSWGDGSARVWPLFLVRSLAQVVLVRAKGSRLLHIQVTEGGSLLRKGLAFRLGRALGMRIVLHHHGAKLEDEYQEYRPGPRAWLKGMVQKADVNVTLGERGTRFLNQVLDVPVERIVILPNAINDMKDLVRPSRLPGAPTHYLLMANLSPRKGVGEFLVALRQLKDSGLPLKATLAGGGEVERYIAEAEQLGIGNICTFTGWIGRQQVASLLGDADALVLPSHQEVLPMAILEALSAGIPVISTPVGSIPEVLSDGQTGLLVTPGDVDALAEAMRRVAQDEAMALEIVANARRLYEQRFDMEQYMVKLLAIYQRVLERR